MLLTYRRCLLLLAGFPLLLTFTIGAQDVLTERYDNYRTGSTRQTLTPVSLAQGWSKTGKALTVVGRVYAQPLYVHQLQGVLGGQPRNVVFIATEENNIYAFDADTLAPLWSRPLGPNDRSKTGSGCDGISTDGIGIEATPVIDRLSNRIYISYRLNPAQLTTTAQQEIIALDIRTGEPVLGPTLLNNRLFRSEWERNRASLLLLNANIYVAFASRCEDPNQPVFHGFVAAFNAGTLAQSTLFAITNDPSLFSFTNDHIDGIDGGGIWQASSGLASDGTDIYAITGNRRLNKKDGQPDGVPNVADSILRLHPAQTPNGALQLSVADWFTPYRKLWMDSIDLDLGSAGPTLIPDSKYLIGGGKQGWLYLVDTSNMGHLDSEKQWTDANLGALPADATEDQFPEDMTADKVLQKFQVGVQQYIPAVASHLSIPGSPVAVAVQAGNQIDVFTTGRNGAVYVTNQGPSGQWSDGKVMQDGRHDDPFPAAITPVALTKPGAYVAAALQSSNQLDAFVAGNDGAVYVTSVAGLGRWTDGGPGASPPLRITPPGITPAGACLATASQGAQLDVFFTGNDGSVYVTFVAGSAPWTDGVAGRRSPLRITPPNFAVPGSCVASDHQSVSQLDVFAINKNDRALYVTSVAGGGTWTDGVASRPAPVRITPVHSVDPGAVIAAAQQTSSQLDVFFPGLDGAVHVTWVGQGAWTDGNPGHGMPAAITPPNSIPSSGAVTAAMQTATQLDVLYIDNTGTVMVTSVAGLTAWARPVAASTALTVGGARLIASSARAGQVQTFAVGRDGEPWVTKAVGQAPWTDGQFGRPGPQGLSRALWMNEWEDWPHIHGGPVFVKFNDGSARLYIWPEKDHLKSFAWTGSRVDLNSKRLGTGENGQLILDPDGMPGGMLAVSIDSTAPAAGIVFASLTQTSAIDGPGILRAFDAISLKEVWNNQGESYQFSKFVPPLIANNRVYLPTCSNKVLVYGR